jgi:hypothetical protein
MRAVERWRPFLLVVRTFMAAQSRTAGMLRDRPRSALAAQQPVERGAGDAVERGGGCHERFALGMARRQRGQPPSQRRDRLDRHRDARLHHAAVACREERGGFGPRGAHRGAPGPPPSASRR